MDNAENVYWVIAEDSGLYWSYDSGWGEFPDAEVYATETLARERLEDEAGQFPQHFARKVYVAKVSPMHTVPPV